MNRGSCNTMSVVCKRKTSSFHFKIYSLTHSLSLSRTHGRTHTRTHTHTPSQLMFTTTAVVGLRICVYGHYLSQLFYVTDKSLNWETFSIASLIPLYPLNLHPVRWYRATIERWGNERLNRWREEGGEARREHSRRSRENDQMKVELSMEGLIKEE